MEFVGFCEGSFNCLLVLGINPFTINLRQSLAQGEITPEEATASDRNALGDLPKTIMHM